MNMLKKSIALFIVIAMVLAAVPAVLAAECLPGDSVTVSLSLGSGYGIDGSITVSDPDGIISNVTFSGPSGYDGFIDAVGGGRYGVYYSKIDVGSIGSCTITAKVILSSNSALAGKSATISFSGTTSQYVNGGFEDVSASASASVTMKAPAPAAINYDALKQQIRTAESLDKDDYTADSWNAMISALNTAKQHLTSNNQSAVDTAAANLAAAIRALVKAGSSDPEQGGGTKPEQGGSTKPEQGGSSQGETTKVDYEELKKQISVAESLNKGDYTADSWKAVEDALANGKNLLTSKDQAAVNQAAADLAAAINALVKANYSKLESAIASANEYLDGNQIGELYKNLMDALSEGNALLGSGDQAAADEAADKILNALEALKQAIADAAKDGEGEEGSADCDHSGPYCNIWIHKLWPILFFISLIGNIVLVLFLFFKKKKKKSEKK